MTTNSIHELINLIRTRPAMYIGRNSIVSFNAFIYGWYARNPEGTIDEYGFLENFQAWIEERYKISTGNHWTDIILFLVRMDEKHALEVFFEYYDDWYAEVSAQYPPHTANVSDL